jgi:hypothetical protein
MSRSAPDYTIAHRRTGRDRGLDDLLTRVLHSELAGSWIRPDPDDIIRSVGDPQDGVCVVGNDTYHL